MSDQEKERLHRFGDGFVSMGEAAVIACLTLSKQADANVTIPDAQRNEMAAKLARFVTVYSLDPDRSSVRTLTAEDIHGGAFTHGGRVIKFQDGRPTTSGLAITRTSLKAALQQLK